MWSGQLDSTSPCVCYRCNFASSKWEVSGLAGQTSVSAAVCGTLFQHLLCRYGSAVQVHADTTGDEDSVP